MMHPTGGRPTATFLSSRWFWKRNRTETPFESLDHIRAEVARSGRGPAWFSFPQ